MPRPSMLLVEGFAEGFRESYLGQLYMSTHLREVRRIMHAGPNWKASPVEQAYQRLAGGRE